MRNALKIMVAIAAIIAVIAAIFYYANYDPAVYPSLRCPVKTLTGYNCPGCGCQRALHALLSGKIAEAWHYNSFIFIAAPISIFYIIIESNPTRFARLHRIFVTPMAAIALLLAIIIATIANN